MMSSPYAIQKRREAIAKKLEEKFTKEFLSQFDFTLPEGWSIRPVIRHSTRCLVCDQTIFRSRHGNSHCVVTDNDNKVCLSCMVTWEHEGGQLGKISRSKIPGAGFTIKQHLI